MCSFKLKIKRTKRLWGDVRSLTSLQLYANPRSSYPAPGENSNGFIFAKIFGGFEKIRSSICDLVTIARLLNATLVIPGIQQITSSRVLPIFMTRIISLKNDVNIVKTLPKYLKPAGKRSEFPIVKPQNSASPNFYVKEVLPKLKKAKVVGLIITDGGCLQITVITLQLALRFRFAASHSTKKDNELAATRLEKPALIPSQFHHGLFPVSSPTVLHTPNNHTDDDIDPVVSKG
ncbi:hypothetical protein V6N12_004083 [Hibiscus sabdariffa]|uniref:O-fucosyltransferase family protein n=1 Tax=Hibiscus sabdariffa TaxID=183260 RepID=A0ABR2CKE0_9ROSI